jgi:hypothetical protein
MQTMRRVLGELALLAGGVLLGIVLISITTLNSGVGHPGGSVTWGYPWVWRWAASASPGYTNLVILYEDVGFWLVLSVALAELPVRIAALSVSRRLRGSGDQGAHRLNGQVSRGLLVVASAIIVAALLVSTSMFVAAGTTTTTETVTTTTTLTTTSIVATTPVSVTTTSCTVSGPTLGVVIQVLANNYTGNGVSVIPVVGAKVSGEAVGYCNNILQPSTLQPTTTNSSGWASLLDGQFGLYNLEVAYAPTLVFNLSIVTNPSSVTYVTFNISTGNMTTHFCEFNVCRTGTG